MTPVFELSPDHIPLIERHFDRLPAPDLRLRFGAPLSREAVRAYVLDLDWPRDAAFAVFAADLELAGVAHLARLVQGAELGLSVLPQYRGQGVGTALFQRALLRARNLCLGRVFVHCLAENEAMLQLARRAGMAIVQAEAEADAYIELPAGSFLTIGQELMEQQLALFDWALKVQAGQLRRLAPGPLPAAPARRRPELRLIEGGAVQAPRRRYG